MDEITKLNNIKDIKNIKNTGFLVDIQNNNSSNEEYSVLTKETFMNILGKVSEPKKENNEKTN